MPLARLCPGVQREVETDSFITIPMVSPFLEPTSYTGRWGHFQDRRLAKIPEEPVRADSSYKDALKIEKMYA